MSQDSINKYQSVREGDQVQTEVKDIPEGLIYTPPEGAPNIIMPNGSMYVPDDPSKETDRLINWERQYLYPLAARVGMVFDVQSITDDLYRAMPEEQKARVLSCIVSRTEIQKALNGINWDAVVVVVKKYPIVKINCDLDFSNNLFGVRRIQFWTNKLNKYVTSEDAITNRYFEPAVLLQMLDNYRLMEGIV